MNGRTHAVHWPRPLPVAIHGNIGPDGQIVDLYGDLLGELRLRRMRAAIGVEIAVDRDEQLALSAHSWLENVGMAP